MTRPRIRGIRLRLALALLLVVAGALGVVYMIIVPSLETELVNAKLDQLEEDARTVAPGLVAAQRRAAAAVRGVRVLGRPGARRHLHRDRRPALQPGRLESVLVARRRAQSGCKARRRDRHAAARHDRAERAPVRGGGAGRGPDRLRDPAQRLALRPAFQRRLRPAAAARGRPDRVALRGCGRLRARFAARTPHRPARARRRADRRPGGSTSPSSIPATTSSGSWRTPSSACASGWRTSTGPGASSSPTRRTSCGRRSSRSAAFSS